jgi:hypothetical protein
MTVAEQLVDNRFSDEPGATGDKDRRPGQTFSGAT